MLMFAEPEYHTAKHMASLQLSGASTREGAGKTSYPPKHPKDVLSLILQGDTGGISLVEWNRFITVAEIWQDIEQSPEKDDVVLSVFAEAEINAEFRQLLMLKAVLTLEQNEEMLPTLLFSHLPILSKSLKGVDSERFSFLVLLSQEDTIAISELLFQRRILPHQLLSHFGWPTYTQLLRIVERAFIHHLSDLDWWHDEKYLLSSLISLAEAHQLKLVEHVIPDLNERNITPEVKNWFVSKCSPKEVDSLWGKLSSSAKEVLVKRFKFALFRVHQQIVNRFISENKSAIDSHDDPNVTKRMKSRMGFWSNYSERILNSRLLVPETNKYNLKKADAGLKVSVIEPLSSPLPTEILILEFEKIVIVDQLRPTGAAVRIFNSEYSSVSTLINQSISTERDVLVLHQDDIHDHGFYWQWSLESLLRQTYHLIPNPGLVRFNSLGNNLNAYVHGQGLRKLNKQRKDERIEKLEVWTASFMRMEQLLGKYGGMESVETNLTRNKIRLLKSVDKNAEYVEALRKEASAGHSWAIKELAHYLLTKPSASYDERMEGEKWLEKAKQ